MAVPSGDYFEGEGGSDSSTGASIALCVVALVVLMSVMTSKIKRCQNVNQRPNTEIHKYIDTLRVSDTINVYGN